MKIRFAFILKKQELYVIFYFLTYIFHYFADVDIRITFVLWIFTGILGYFALCREFKENFNALSKMLLVDCIGAVGLWINGSHSVVNIFILILSHLLGLYLFCYRDSLKHLSNITYLLLVCIAIYTFTTPKVLVNKNFGEYMTRFSDLVGGNTISIFLLLFLSIETIRNYYDKKNINYLFITMALVVSSYAGGMGGVLSIGVFLLGMACINLKTNRLSGLKTIFVLALCLLSIGVAIKKDMTISLNDNSRFWIWSNYLSCAKKSFVDFLFGGNIESIPFLYNLKNMHNTFINWHYYYGLIPFIFYLSIVIRTFVFNLKNKNLYLVIILGCIFLRAFTDETTFCFMPIWTYAYLDMHQIN